MAVKVSKTKKKLAESLRRLVCEQKFNKISIDMICSEVDVTRRSFYRHFQDKYELLGFIYDMDFTFDFTEHPDWNMFDYFPHFCRILYDNRKFYMNAYRISGQNSLRDHCYEWLFPILHSTYEDYFKSLKESGSVLDLVKLEGQIFHVLNDSTFDAIIDWLGTEPCISPDEFSDEMIKIYRTFGLYVYETIVKREMA